ncbi:MAG: FTR1 family protein [Deinococcales bacterium]
MPSLVLSGRAPHRRAAALLLVLAAAFLALAPVGHAQQVDVAAELHTAHDMVAHSLRLYREGHADEAYRLSRSAYLEHFEYAEPKLRVLDPDLILDTEFLFANLRNAMRAGASMHDLEGTATKIYANLQRAETVVSGTGALAPTLAAGGSFFILFREGLEVVLLLGAILAYLRSTRNDRLAPGVWYGLGAALLATGLTYLAASTVLRVAPASRELLSGLTSVVAVGILFYLSFWMLQQSDRRRHMEFMRARLGQAVQRGSLLAVAGAAFASVYREGFETVLLYQALVGVSGSVMAYLWLGLGLGALALLVVSFVILRLQRRLPLQAFFRVAVTVTALLAVAFAGNAVRALQGAGWLPITNLLGTLPRLNPSLASLTGFHPTLETVLAQASLIAVYAVGMVAFLLRRERIKRRSASTAAGDAASG